MEWEEWLQVVGVKEGMQVWICDYRFLHSMIDKPIRHIPPTLVSIVSAKKVKKNIYYSDWCFVKINKNGTISKKIIAPYDNTSFKHRTGKAIQIFRTEKLANKYYNKICDELIERTEEEFKVVKEKYLKKKRELEKCLK